MAILSGNAKISTVNAKLTSAMLPRVSAKPAHDIANVPQPQTSLLNTPGTPSGSLKRKASEAVDENSQQQLPDGMNSPTKAAKSVGRPKKSVDPEKAAKVGLEVCMT